MRKNIWIINHYATDQFVNKSGRHYWFAQHLKARGYAPVVFCANTVHNTDDVIHVRSKYHLTESVDSIPFVFVKTNAYAGNGPNRFRNMINFYRNVFPAAKRYMKKHGKPDVIFASSVHPLTLVAAIQLAKHFNVPCICEVRDLWPESIVAYGVLKREQLFTQLLYRGEKWIYEQADAVVMTWEGGRDYIVDQGWENDIPLDKIHHINNGVVIDTFDKNSETYVIDDPDLQTTEFKNVVYTGSIRKVNNLGLLLDAAKIIQERGENEIRFLIYGTGNERVALEKRCQTEQINNVIFKGRVERKFIPSIVKQSHINIVHNSSTSLDKYGQSQNKLFEYLAAGRPIVQTYKNGYSICERYECGIHAETQTAEQIANTIIQASRDGVSEKMGENARQAAYDYDFNVLTEKLIHIIEHEV